MGWMSKLFLGSILAWKAHGLCTGCTATIAGDDTQTVPGNTNKFMSFASSQLSENGIVAWQGYDTKSSVGLYFNTPTRATDYYVDQKNCKSADTSLSYTGLIRGDNSGSVSKEMMSFIGRTSTGAAVYYANIASGTKTWVTVASKNTTVPGATNKFTDFIDSSIDASNGHVVFQGEYSGGAGIYFWNSSSRVVSKIADYNSVLPGTTLKFTYLNGPKIAGNRVLFFGSSYNASAPPAKAALVLYDISTATFTTVVDYRNTIPGFGNQTYSSFSTPGMDTQGNYITFVAQGTGNNRYWGVLKYTVSSKLVQNVVDETMPTPGYANRYFTGTQGPPSVDNQGRVAFRVVHEPDAITGVWLATPSGNSFNVIRVVGVTSNLPSIGVIERIGFNGDSFLGQVVVITATVRLSGTARAGVYRITLPNSDLYQNTTQQVMEDDKYTPILKSTSSLPLLSEKESHLKYYE